MMAHVGLAEMYAIRDAATVHELAYRMESVARRHGISLKDTAEWQEGDLARVMEYYGEASERLRKREGS